MEGEYITLTEAVKELMWLKNILKNESLNLKLNECLLFCDKQMAVSFSHSPIENARMKHIDVKYHFL